MNLLIVAATKLEIKPFLKKINCHNKHENGLITVNFDSLELDILIAGIGLVFTTYNLTKALAKKKYDLVLNVGIAGAFSKDLQIGEVVNVTEEEFSDLGIEHPNQFKTLFEESFVDKDNYPFSNGRLFNGFSDNKMVINAKKVKAISSNTAHGNENSIERIRGKFNPDIETMEGAAFFYVCLQEKVKFAQIRTISNYVEPRNKDNWDISLAINNLGNYLAKLIKSI